MANLNKSLKLSSHKISDFLEAFVSEKGMTTKTTFSLNYYINTHKQSEI